MLPVVPFLGYRISTERDVGACILSMRMAFKHVSKLPEHFKFIANGYSAYPLAAQQFYREFKEDFKFDIDKKVWKQVKFDNHFKAKETTDTKQD